MDGQEVLSINSRIFLKRSFLSAYIFSSAIQDDVFARIVEKTRLGKRRGLREGSPAITSADYVFAEIVNWFDLPTLRYPLALNLPGFCATH